MTEYLPQGRREGFSARKSLLPSPSRSGAGLLCYQGRAQQREAPRGEDKHEPSPDRTIQSGQVGAAWEGF